MKSIHPYLYFNGNAEEAFEFYRSIFGGELTLMRYKDAPNMGELFKSEKDMVMHVMLPLGKAGAMMASDVLESRGLKVDHGNDIVIMINPESEPEARRIFRELSEGGRVQYPLDKMFWNALNGMFIDKFGIHWMVNYDLGRE